MVIGALTGQHEGAAMNIGSAASRSEEQHARSGRAAQKMDAMIAHRPV
jgi:hypothetical protein